MFSRFLSWDPETSLKGSAFTALALALGGLDERFEAEDRRLVVAFPLEKKELVGTKDMICLIKLC